LKRHGAISALIILNMIAGIDPRVWQEPSVIRSRWRFIAAKAAERLSVFGILIRKFIVRLHWDIPRCCS